jgi:subtilisin family serine protease
MQGWPKMTPEGEISNECLAFQQQFVILQQIGAVLVAAASNSGIDREFDVDDLVPAALGATVPSLIVVGAANFDNTVSPYSSRSRQGGLVSLYGFGDYSWCAATTEDDDFTTGRGTSHAAAQVAGLAAEKLKDIPEGTQVADIPGFVKRELQEDGLRFREIVRPLLPLQQIAPLASTGVGVRCDTSNEPTDPLSPLAPIEADLILRIPQLEPISFSDGITLDLVEVDKFVCYLRIRV